MVMLEPGDLSPEAVRRFTRAEYERMAEIGLFEDERVELLYGVIVPMNPIGPPHASTVDLLAEVFFKAISDRARIRVQGSFAASDESEPEPDLALYPRDTYRRAHPSEAWLVVEVADSSLGKDRGVKMRLYAECGVEEYWVVNLSAGRVEVYSDPDGGEFQSRAHYERGSSIRLRHFPDVTIDVDRFLP